MKMSSDDSDLNRNRIRMKVWVLVRISVQRHLYLLSSIVRLDLPIFHPRQYRNGIGLLVVVFELLSPV